MQISTPKVYFPGLNGLRFIAALLVIINHIEVIKFFLGYKNYMEYPFFTSIGGLSVTLFFVLSGFLITYLLLKEKENEGTINIKKFYFKRILRIWPLYFFIVITGLFIINRLDFFYIPRLSEAVSNHFGIKFFLFLIILPNVVAVFFSSIPYMQFTWSIGVEEQFYLIWPWIIKRTQDYVKTLLIIILFMIILSATARFVNSHANYFFTDSITLKVISDITLCISMFRISSMAIGGLGAWALFYKKEFFLRIICRKDIQLVTLLLTVAFFLIDPNILLIKHECYSILFCIIIINLASNRQPIISLENKTLNFLGKISYGLYMYHSFIIGLSIGILKQIKGYEFGTPLANLILYPIVVILTIAIATASYYLFENKFLKMGSKMENISDANISEK